MCNASFDAIIRLKYHSELEICIGDMLKNKRLHDLCLIPLQVLYRSSRAVVYKYEYKDQS